MLKKVKNLLQQIPVIRFLARSLRTRKLKAQTPEQVFTDIYKANTWRGKESISGQGSEGDQTAIIVERLPQLFKEYNVSALLDIPCGDFYWMKTVDLTKIQYTGADIVDELIASNNDRFKSDAVSFRRLDLIKDPLPQVDLVFCRDCLVHLSFADTMSALRNLCDSQSSYILTTTFTDRQKNTDIFTGDWRAINLEKAPFNFPPPLLSINEGCTEFDGAFADKSLGLWKLSDIKECLTKS